VRLRLPLRDSRHEVCDEGGRHGVTRAADANRAEVLGEHVERRLGRSVTEAPEAVEDFATADDPTAADPIDAVAVPRGIIVPC
jgi:hypothetical protein